MRSCEPRSRKIALQSIDQLVADLEGQLQTARAARDMLHSGATPAQVGTALGITNSGRITRPWAVRRGTLAELVVGMLRTAGPEGMTELAIVHALSDRHKAVKDPRRSVHWTLYNLRRRSGALDRRADGRWVLVGEIPMRGERS